MGIYTFVHNYLTCQVWTGKIKVVFYYAEHSSVNVHHGALLLVPKWQCISSFVFYMIYNMMVTVFLCVGRIFANIVLAELNWTVFAFHSYVIMTY